MDLLIFGAGSFARLMRGFFENDAGQKVRAFIVDAAYREENTLDGLPVLTPQEALAAHPPGDLALYTAIGYARMRDRKALYERGRALGYAPTSFVSNSAHVSHGVTLGDNCAVFPGVILEPNVKVGTNNILWSQGTLCHDVRLGDHNFVAAGSVIGGHTQVGEACFLGFNAAVAHNLVLADETLVGAGSVLLESSQAHGRYLGSPARLVSTHAESGIEVT